MPWVVYSTIHRVLPTYARQHTEMPCRQIKMPYRTHKQHAHVSMGCRNTKTNTHTSNGVRLQTISISTISISLLAPAHVTLRPPHSLRSLNQHTHISPPITTHTPPICLLCPNPPPATASIYKPSLSLCSLRFAHAPLVRRAAPTSLASLTRFAHSLRSRTSTRSPASPSTASRCGPPTTRRGCCPSATSSRSTRAPRTG